MKHIRLTPFILLCALFGCSGQPESTQKEKPVFVFNDELKEIITIDTVKSKEVVDELMLNAKVTFNQQQVANVYPIFGGMVTAVFAEIGDYVKKGEILASIRSLEVAEYKKELKEAEQNTKLTQRNLKATEEMYEAGMASEREFLEAQQEYMLALEEEKKLDEIFSIHNFSENAIYHIKSPVTGFVTEKNITKEMQIRSDQTEEIFTISGLEDVWIMAEVYESDISKVHEGEKVRIVTLSYPDKPFTGYIDKVYNVLDEESKTMKVRIKLANENYLLKPGMFATVYVEKRENERILPCIDAHALVFENGKDYVVVSSADKMEIREVEVYKPSSTQVYILSGIREGDHIVNKNVLLVYNALSEE